MPNTNLYDYALDHELGPDFQAQAIRAHRQQQLAKLTGNAKTTGSWIANNPPKVLALAFAALVVFSMVSTDEQTPTPPAEVQSLGETSPL